MNKTKVFLCLLSATIVLKSFAFSPFLFPSKPSESFEWQTVQPEEVGLESQYLRKLVQHIKDSNIYSVDGIVVVKNGKIALEEYFNGFTKDSLHNVTSVGKSLTSALTGIAINQGLILDKRIRLTDCLNEAYDIQNLTSQKQQIEIQHILTMSSGLACDDWDETSPGNEQKFQYVPNVFAYVLNLPMLRDPGEKFAYCTGGANLLGEIIRKKSGKSLKDYADESLFRRIGVEENEWFIVPNPAGKEYSGGGNLLKPRDMARFGLLYLNMGRWQNEQIVPREWVEESTKKQIKTPDGESYGYFWWIKEFKHGDKVISAFEASGNGGNKITVIPELDLVIVLTGSGYGSVFVEGEQAHAIMEKYIIASVK